MKIAVISIASENLQVAELFPFADDFIEVDGNLNLDKLSVFSESIELVSEDIDYIVFAKNSPAKKYDISDFFDENNRLIYQYEMLPKKDWDLSKSSWKTKTFANDDAERIFNARDIVYRKYGVNFRFFIENNSCFVCSVASIKKAVQLCEKNKLDIEKVHGSLVAYLDFLNKK